MWNPGLDRHNRKARRAAAKWNGDMKRGWQAIKDEYRPTNLPIRLGINRFKRDHPNDNKLNTRFKTEAWAWFYAPKDGVQ